MVKTVVTALAAAVLASVAPPAGAQQAAARLPNSFGAPPTPTTAPESAPQTQAAVRPLNPRSEAVLRQFIASVQASAPDYSLLSDDLAARLREQDPRVGPILRGFGALKSVTLIGPNNGADVYRVAFDKAETDWVIGFNPTGKVGALLFRPSETD